MLKTLKTLFSGGHGQPALRRAKRNAGVLGSPCERDSLFQIGPQDTEALHRHLALLFIQGCRIGGRGLIARYFSLPVRIGRM